MAVLTKITTRSLADNAVSSAKIQDGAIAVADVADGSISTAKLADDAVTQAKIGAGAVGNTEVNSSAGIVATKLASIPNSKLEDDPLSGTNAKALGAGATFSTEQQELHGSTFTASGTGATVTGDLKLKSLVDKEVVISGTGTITGSGGRIIGEGIRTEARIDDPSSLVRMGAGGNINVGEVSASNLNLGGTLLKGKIAKETTWDTGYRPAWVLKKAWDFRVDDTKYVDFTPSRNNSMYKIIGQNICSVSGTAGYQAIIEFYSDGSWPEGGWGNSISSREQLHVNFLSYFLYGSNNTTWHSVGTNVAGWPINHNYQTGLPFSFELTGCTGAQNTGGFVEGEQYDYPIQWYGQTVFDSDNQGDFGGGWQQGWVESGTRERGITTMRFCSTQTGDDYRLNWNEGKLYFLEMTDHPTSLE